MPSIISPFFHQGRHTTRKISCMAATVAKISCVAATVAKISCVAATVAQNIVLAATVAQNIVYRFVCRVSRSKGDARNTKRRTIFCATYETIHGILLFKYRLCYRNLVYRGLISDRDTRHKGDTGYFVRYTKRYAICVLFKYRCNNIACRLSHLSNGVIVILNY